MKTLKPILIVALQVIFLKEILSDYEIIPERFETLLGDDDKIVENVNLRIKKFNRSQ
jgi:hypothetical protein